MTPLDALIRSLARRGVRRMFGVPGGETSLDAIAAASAAGIDFVLARHETGAAIMALATAEVTGTPGVLLTTRGPGLANAANGIACAALERAPLCVVSDGFSAEHRRFVTHQFFEHADLLAPVARVRAASTEPTRRQRSSACSMRRWPHRPGGAFRRHRRCRAPRSPGR